MYYKIALIGMHGSGKSTVGRELAEELSIDFADTDKYIEQKYGDLNSIFQVKGEHYFRCLEYISLYDLTLQHATKPFILSCGSGIIESEISRIVLKNYFTIYLKVSIEELAKRLYGTDRPLLQNQVIQTTLQHQLSNRAKEYEKADLIIENNKDIETVRSKILWNLADLKLFKS